VNVCMCVCMYLYACMYVYVCMHACKLPCIYTTPYTHQDICHRHICMHACMKHAHSRTSLRFRTSITLSSDALPGASHLFARINTCQTTTSHAHTCRHALCFKQLTARSYGPSLHVTAANDAHANAAVLSACTRQVAGYAHGEWH
jgi:hypothetical protein